MHISTILAVPCVMLVMYGQDVSHKQDLRTLESQPQSWNEMVDINIDRKPDGTPTACRDEYRQCFSIVRDKNGQKIRIGEKNRLVRGVTPHGSELYWLQTPDGTRAVVIDW